MEPEEMLPSESAAPGIPDSAESAAAEETAFSAADTPTCQKFRLPTWLKTPENASRAVFLIGPWLAYLMVEVLNNNNPFTALTSLQIALNLMWYYLIFWLTRLLVGRKGLAAGAASALCFLFGLANHYVLTFRGRIIFPCDVLGIGTAANVAGGFDYTPDRNVWIAAGILLGYWILILLSRLVFRSKGRQKLPLPFALATWAAMAVFLFSFFCTPLLPSIGIWVQQWKTQANGFLLNFTTALRYSFVSAPNGYSDEAAEAIAQRIMALPDLPSDAEPPENLIVIMNESLSDLTSAFLNLELSEDDLPFLHALTENTVKGTMISPVTGGGTANVEFEYLTGNSLAFLPTNTVAYQLYCYNGMPSMVSQAKQAGYRALSFHPYMPSGWNRTSVYTWMGFDQQYYQEDVISPHIVRKFISDSSDYQQLFRWTDENEGPTFLFNVTMQNHSGYNLSWTNLEHAAKAVAPMSPTAETNQFFALMRESDRALEELITHYADSDERTMVVVFGDHQPPLNRSFYEKLYGKPLDNRTTEEVFQEYSVPFFIWANYDIPEQQNVVISSNYLGVLTAQLAGLELTGWQKQLSYLMEQLPVCTTVGFMTADGTIVESEEDLPEALQAMYSDYRILAYNQLFDEDHHPDGFFG